jgi:hypothetical protein
MLNHFTDTDAERHPDCSPQAHLTHPASGADDVVDTAADMVDPRPGTDHSTGGSPEPVPMPTTSAQRTRTGQFARGNTIGRSLGRTFEPGNVAGRRHGLYGGDNPEPDPTVLAQYVADDGGLEHVAARRLDTLRNRALVQRRIEQLQLALADNGLFDRRGKLRVGWLTMFDRFVNTAKALDGMLGLERRAKPVETFEEYMSARYGAPAEPATPPQERPTFEAASSVDGSAAHVTAASLAGASDDAEGGAGAA